MSSLETPSAFAMEDVRRTVLDNGLVVLAKEVHTSPIVTAMIWYRVGSRNEELGQTGKSHFLEHMLFKGTERFKKGQIDLITLKNGGGNNAFTSHDFTAYYFNFASDRWDVALEIESDRIINCAFDPEEFEAERKVVIEELNRFGFALGTVVAGTGSRRFQGTSLSESHSGMVAGCGARDSRGAT